MFSPPARPDLRQAPTRARPDWEQQIFTRVDAEALFTNGVWRYVEVRVWQRRGGQWCCRLEFYGDPAARAAAGGGWYIHDPKRLRPARRDDQ